MARIENNLIEAARNVRIAEVWLRLGLPPVKVGAAFHSPFREDKKPSCQLGGDKNIFFDHATGESLDTIALTRKVQGCGFVEAVAFVLERTPESIQGKSKQSPYPTSTAPVDAIAELAKVRGWKPEALQALGAEAKNAQAPREVHFPMRDAAGKSIGTRRRQANGSPYSDGGKVKCVRGSKQGLICPWPFPDDPEQPVLIVEGEADAAAALSADNKAVAATPGAQPSKNCLRQLQLLVSGRKVVMFPDPDEAGRKWLNRVGKALLNAQCPVRYVPCADDDLDKRLRQAASPGKALADLIETAIAFEPQKSKPSGTRTHSSGLAQIQVNNRQLRDIIADSWAAVHARNNPATTGQGPQPFIFKRSGGLVRLSCGEHDLQIEPMDEHAVFGMLARVADWVRVTDEACIDTSPVKDVARDMLAYPDEKLPPLDAVATTPLFGTTGDLITAPGYHRSERLWFESQKDLYDLDFSAPENLMNIEAARALLVDDLLVDFPFVDESDRAHALAALILPFVRRMITGCTPIHLVEAPMAGSGKGLLCHLISIVATGRVSDSRTLASQDDEARKMLTAELSRGRPIILLDNTDERKKLDCPSLASVVTAETWTDRLLGKSTMLTLPNRALWLITGNNPALSMEIARRCVRIRIDPRVDRPWRRNGFKHPVVVEWARENRCRLVRAILVIVRAWLAAGQPTSDQRLGSFERWSAVLGGILEVVGIRGFLGSLDDLYDASDAEGQAWREFTSQWWETFGQAPVKVAELNDFCESRNLMVSERGDGSYRSQETRLGFALSRARDRVFGGLRLTRAETRGRAMRGAHYALARQDPDINPGPQSDPQYEDGTYVEGGRTYVVHTFESQRMHGLSDDKSDGYENGTYGAHVEGGTHAGARARTRAPAHMRVDGANVCTVCTDGATSRNKSKKGVHTLAPNVCTRSAHVCTDALYPDQPIDLALIPDIDPDEPDPPE